MAGYQRRHGEKGAVATGETLLVPERNIRNEVSPISLTAKWADRQEGGG
ncbi:MAG: hypothetical protein QY317_08700 [Candidatus Jettenia caeni]|nr:MAG: hypothetical protein QY317_08700 [Candidatus Jettenia caeni]